MPLPSLPQDKANHLVYGAVIFDTVFIATRSLALSFGVVVMFAFGKEIMDAYSNYKATKNLMQGSHGVELLDSVATCSGGVLAALPLFIINF